MDNLVKAFLITGVATIIFLIVLPFFYPPVLDVYSYAMGIK